MTAVSLASRARTHVKKAEKLDIISFVTSEAGLRIRPNPSQRFLLRVMEKEELDDTVADIIIPDQFNEQPIYRLTEAGFYQYLWDEGRISLPYDIYCNTNIIQYVLSMGRRATKSTTIGMWQSYKLYEMLQYDCPQVELFNIIETDRINLSLTALGENNAKKLLAKVTGMIAGSPFFKPFLLEGAGSSQEMKLWTHRDLQKLRERKIAGDQQTHSITVTAQANSPGVRGDNNVFVTMEEAAHFVDGKSSKREKPLDDMIYEALAPSVSGFKTRDGKPYGRTFMISSPRGRTGRFASELLGAFDLGAESYTLAVIAPTWEFNPAVDSTYLRSAYNKSKASYRQEYGAELIDGINGWLTEPGLFYLGVRSGVTPTPAQGRLDVEYCMGVDFALSDDGTSVAISHWEPEYREDLEELHEQVKLFLEQDDIDAALSLVQGKVVFDYVEGRRAGQGVYQDRRVLLMDDLLEWISGLAQSWPCVIGMYDQWSGELIKQEIAKKPDLDFLQKVVFSEMINDAMQRKFYELYSTQGMKIPDCPRVHRELLNLQEKHKAGNYIKVEAPPGGKDDTFDAMFRSAWLTWTLAHDKILRIGEVDLGLKLYPAIRRRYHEIGGSAGIVTRGGQVYGLGSGRGQAGGSTPMRSPQRPAPMRRR